jgi:probable F420-dependent oxidoreductase
MAERIEIGRVGVWVRAAPDARLAQGLEELGFGAIWIGGSPGGELPEVQSTLAATTRIAVATGIVNIWQDDAAGIAAAFHRLAASFPGRFLLGIGAGHPEATSEYTKPYDALVHYLDGLDAADVPTSQRVVAALGPKVLRLAAERSAGAHPYLVTPEHTRRARDLLGPAPLLAPEQHVILEPDDDRARTLARRAIRTYLGLRNYTNNWRRLGFADDDLADGGSDRLIDEVVAHGDAGAVAARVAEQLDAGADHVCIQLIPAPNQDPLAAFAELARHLPF